MKTRHWHGWSKWAGATGVTMLLRGDEALIAGRVLNATRLGRMFTNVSKAKAKDGVTDIAAGQVTKLVPKALRRGRAPSKQVAEGIAEAPKHGVSSFMIYAKWTRCWHPANRCGV